MVGKSRQGLPQSSSHGSAIPRRSSHFGDHGTSLLGCRLRVRRPESLKAPRRWPTSPSLSSICLLQNFNYGGGAHINCCDKLSPTYLLVKSHSLIDSEISLSHEPPFSCLDAPLSTALSRCIAFHISRHIIQVYRCTPPCHLYTHTSPGSPLSWVHLSRPGLVTMCIDVIVFVSRGI